MWPSTHDSMMTAHCKNGDISIWEEVEKVTDVHAGRIFAFLSRKTVMQRTWGNQGGFCLFVFCFLKLDLMAP